METMVNLDGIISTLEELAEDTTVQKNIKSKLESIIGVLKGEEELCIKINKVLNDLDEISNDNNIHTYTRTQIWNVVSMLEMAECQIN